MNIKEYLKKIDWKHIFILFLIFMLAFSFRAHILRYDLMFEFDTYWHMRMNADFIDTGKIPDMDTMGTYHNVNKQPIIKEDYVGFWLIGYIFYKLITFGGAYDKEVWISIVRVLPALYGALTALASYLLFKWGYKSRKIGYLGAVIVSILPGFIYRQMGGFYEEDAIGFLWMILGFAFLVRAVREPMLSRENVIYATLAGIMFGIMSYTWAVFVIVPVLIEAYFICALLWNLYKGVPKNELVALASLFAITFVITSAFAFGSQEMSWIDYQIGYAKGFLGFEDGISANNENSGVGEESKGLPHFGTKYGVFNIFILTGIIASLYGIYRRKNDYVTMLYLLWGLMTMYLAINKLKSSYWFGLGLAILTLVTFAELYLYLSKKKDLGLKVFFAMTTILLLFGGFASGVVFVHNHAPNIITNEGWMEAVYFMQDELPQNAKVMNWWNWGHWITFMGEKRAATDNTNGDQQANIDFSSFLTNEDLNKSLGILKAYDTDYVVFEARDVANQNVYGLYAYGREDYRTQTRYGNMINCYKVSQGYQCGQNIVSSVQMSSIATNHQSKPNDMLNNKLPVFYYTNLQKNKLWVINTINNDSMGAKMWFNHESVKDYFELVYDNSTVRIWKVNKDKLSDVKPFMQDLTLEEVEEWNSKLYWLD